MPATVPIVDRALAAADAGLHVFPCAPMSKQPLKGIEWRKAATTDALQILAWFRETPNANYGIACGPGSDLGVVDLDGKASLEWWAARDFEQGALVRTPSGGRHVYYRTDATTEVQTNQGKIFKDEATGAQIDIRGWGGYVVGPGSMLPTGTYVGDIENIPMMPQAVLDILPEHQVFEYVRPDVAQVESATPAEERQLRSIAEWLRSLPSEWTPGAGWHDTVYRSACWLSRMVNSPEYALTPEQALDVLMAHTPTYAHWGPENIVRQWESAVQSTFGQYAETPRPVRELPAFAHVANKITLGGVEVDNLIAGAAHEDSWKDRRLLIATGAENGLDRDELVALAWQSPHGEAAGATFEQVEREVDAAIASATMGDGAGVEPAPPVLAPVSARFEPAPHAILTDEERAYVNGPEGDWWGARYCRYAETRVGMYNAPYHRMSRWTILALRFSQYAYIPLKEGPLGLNLFQMTLGNTTTGKTEAYKVKRRVIQAVMGDDSPDIGGDASPNALIEKLLERDGRSTWFNADEAHGLFKEMQSTTWRAGLREKWTQLYDGRVPMQQRNGNKDISGQDAKAHFTMDLMGTALGMMEVLDSDDWTSGFLARFVWSIGKELEVDPDDLEVDEQVGDVVAEYNAIPRAYAAEFRMAEIRFAGLDGEVPIPILLTPEAKARHQEVMREFTRLGAKHPQSEMVKPTLIRFQLIIRKCAALVAISEGSKVITLRHHLIALEQAEEWLGNMLAMVAATTASAFARQVDAVEQFIATQPAQEARVERVYRHLKTEKYLVDRLIEQLIAEGRIERERGIDNSVTLRMKRREAIAA